MTPAQLNFDGNFDALRNTDTSDGLQLADADIDSSNLPFGSPYQAVNPKVLLDILGSVTFDIAEWTFVDLGCGKGRALLIAALFPFKKVIGVEFSPLLATIARENISRFAPLLPPGRQVSILDADAADYKFDAKKTFLFLFNPFTHPVMEKVIANIQEACSNHSADIFVVYANPLCHHLFMKNGTFDVISSKDKFVYYRSHQH